MTVEQIETSIRMISERIHVLEAEKVQEKYVRPLYAERQSLLSALIGASKDYAQ